MASNITQVYNDVLKAYEDLLYSQVARHLTRRDCRVELRQPYVKQFLGLAAREGNRAIIQIAPDLGDDKTLEIFCHEAAHARLHFDDLPKHERHKLPSASWKLTDRDVFIQDTKPRETEADRLATRWLDYAKCNAKRSGLRGWLAALLDY